MAVTRRPKAQSELLPDDVLSAVLTLAQRESRSDRFAFRGHDFDIQTIFSDLSSKFPVVRKYFVFSETGPVPYSPMLNESISRLQLSGLIGRENPDYEVLFLRPAADDYFENDLKGRLNADMLAELTEAAKVLLGCVERV